MYKNNKPLFEAGKILKIQMLEELRDFNRDYLDIRYEEYTDGIIKGCAIEIYDNFISIRDGIIKYNNIIYLLKGEEKISYVSNNKYMMLKVRFSDSSKKDDFQFNLSEVFLDENLNLASNEMEICRFKLRDGSRLRGDYIDYTDLSTEFDTVNVIHTIYAGKGQWTVSPKLTQEFGKELLKYNLENPWDISFALMCVQANEPISRDIIMTYIKNKINLDDRFYSNMEIYNHLLQILNTIKNTGSSNGATNRRRQRRILID